MPTGISSSSLTLQQYAQQSNSPLLQYIASSLLDVHSILNDIPFETNSTLRANGARIVGGLPTPAWRKINGSSVVASGTVSPFEEQAYIASNLIDIDRLILLDKNQVGNPGAVQTNMMLKALAYDITDKFFNNNHMSGDVNSFTGIRQRLDDTTTWGTDTACKIDAGGIDLSDAGMTAATANKFIRYIDNILDEMGDPDGNGVAIYMNRNLRRRAAQAIRLLGVGSGFEMTTDAFDRRMMSYRNAVIRSIGVKADQTTEIITSTESAAGANGSSTFTSLYAVKWSQETFAGWQMEPIRIQNLGLRPDEPTQQRIFLEWAIGLYQTYTRGVARLYDIKVA